MALYLLASQPAPCNFTRLSNKSSVPRRVQRIAAANTTPGVQTIIRRSANYKPANWCYESLQSLTSEYQEQTFGKRVKKLKEDVRAMLHQVMDADRLHQLVLIDSLQRLGLCHLFEDEIKGVLSRLYNNNGSINNQKQASLYEVALEFRLLRQHGYDIPKEIFNNFRDDKGNFKSCLGDDCKDILALYEAVYLLVEGESEIFHDAVNFTTKYLKEYVKHNKDQHFSSVVNHALELPLHWRMERLETRWFIDIYETGPDMNPILLELAKLNFNVVQATHQEDLKYSLRWWKKTGFSENLNFARDRLMENFFLSVGFMYEPQFGYGRRMATKVNAFVQIIDDIYDVYGTLDELELLTNAVNRWDVGAMEQLPYYMKISFLALFNNVNEMAFDILKEQRVDIIPYLRKVWADLCKSYLLEARWFSSGYIPTLKEYMDNAWISVSGPVVLMHAYNSSTNPITQEALEFLQEYPNIIRWSSIIVRLADDLGTSSHEMERGDVPKSIQCYMHETGASEEAAREHIQELIVATWMKMNNSRHENTNLPNKFTEIAMNMARMAQCIYQHGDGHGVDHDKEIYEDHIFSVLIKEVV